MAFGANLRFDAAHPESTISMAIKALEGLGLHLVRKSRLYRTPCFPPGAGPDYVNAAACFAVPQDMAPQGILAILHEVEAGHGRRRQRRWTGRTLDIDLLAVGDSVRPDLQTYVHWRDLAFRDQLRLAPDELILPHPRMQDRAFVLVPLAEVAPEWVHPVLGLSVTQMLSVRPAEEIATVTAMPDAVE